MIRHGCIVNSLLFQEDKKKFTLTRMCPFIEIVCIIPHIFCNSLLDIFYFLYDLSPQTDDLLLVLPQQQMKTTFQVSLLAFNSMCTVHVFFFFFSFFLSWT